MKIFELKSGKVYKRCCKGLLKSLIDGDMLIISGVYCNYSISIDGEFVVTKVILDDKYTLLKQNQLNVIPCMVMKTKLQTSLEDFTSSGLYISLVDSYSDIETKICLISKEDTQEATVKINETKENIHINKLYKEMKIKSIRLSCFIYLVASAIALFSQNFRKIPQDTNGFILGYTVNILGIEFNTQVINGKIIFIALGRFGFLVNNIYNVYDTVLDVYKWFCEYYSYFTWGYIKLIKKLYKNNEYIQNKKIHDLVFKMNGTYQEKIGKGV